MPSTLPQLETNLKKLPIATLLALPFLVVLCGPMLDGLHATPASYATPQSTVSAYWCRMIERRHSEALDCFLHEDHREAGNMLALPDLVELRCRDFRLHYREQGMVDVSYKIEYRIAMGDSLARFSTGDRLQLTGEGWKISRPLLALSERP